MIILPNRNVTQTRVLMPVARSQWREPSQSRPRDQFGKQNCTMFRLDARLNDGYLVWRGWFDDRDDLDAFLWSMINGRLAWEQPLWDLPTPAWHPGLGEQLSYNFATVSYLTSPTGSNQTYTVPADWNNSNNNIQVIGAGGSGGNAKPVSGTRYGTGGGGGGYSVINNTTLTQGASVTYQIGTNGTAVTRTTTGTTNGNAGGATWFGAATQVASTVAANGGGGGVAALSGTAAGGVGASTTGAIGATTYAGGSGGAQITASAVIAFSSGGGGAGGPGGSGNNGGSGNTDGSTNGGSGGAGLGGIAGTGFPNTATGTAGGAGSDISASPVYGSGGGGGGYRTPDAAGTYVGFSGGNYGGGGGGITNQSGTSVTSGAGVQGLIVITYTLDTIIPQFLTFTYN